MSHREYVFNSFAAITEHDTNIINVNGIYVGVSGNIRVIAADGSDTTFANVPVGFFPVYGPVIIHTDTTATNMVALRSV